MVTALGGPLLLLVESNAASAQVSIIELADGILHVRVVGELHHSFVRSDLVGICIGHFPRLSHVILQVLQGHTRGVREKGGLS
uniref:Putative secreted protein n=1 Tax=Ixodes ricinus TaxID=34613 RepID=A0A6B0U6H4_IXORI